MTNTNQGGDDFVTIRGDSTLTENGQARSDLSYLGRTSNSQTGALHIINDGEYLYTLENDLVVYDDSDPGNLTQETTVTLDGNEDYGLAINNTDNKLYHIDDLGRTTVIDISDPTTASQLGTGDSYNDGIDCWGHVGDDLLIGSDANATKKLVAFDTDSNNDPSTWTTNTAPAPQEFSDYAVERDGIVYFASSGYFTDFNTQPFAATVVAPADAPGSKPVPIHTGIPNTPSAVYDVGWRYKTVLDGVQYQINPNAGHIDAFEFE